VQLGLCVAFGSALLYLSPGKRNAGEAIFLALLAGMYIETLTAASLMFAGVSLRAAGIMTFAAMAVVTASIFIKRGVRDLRFAIGRRPKWYEWAVLAAILERTVFAVWQLTRTHTYFQDALLHWSGRARSLYGQVNWSFDPHSPFFMGAYIGTPNYPLLAVMWRALNAQFSGGWNDLIARADSLIFFLSVVGLVWLTALRFSNQRWIGAGAAFVAATVPLHAWHAAAGYSDIAVEAFIVAGAAALLRQEWFWSGMMAAGAVWSKNDALVLSIAGFLAATVLMQAFGEEGKWRNVGRFILGLATIAPWIAFNLWHGLGLTPGGGSIAWHSDAPGLLGAAFIQNPTSGILWIGVFAALIYSASAMAKDPAGCGLLALFGISLAAIVFVFTSTNAYEFLQNQTTIHRTLMQFSSTAILIALYGVLLKNPADGPPIKPSRIVRRRSEADSTRSSARNRRRPR